MSIRAFQRVQLAMIVNGEMARRVSVGNFGAWTEELTPLERERLVVQANDAGLALTRTLHKGWRLTKLLTLLPITFRVGDPELLTELVDAFWRRNLPQGLYFEAEATRFAAFVADQVPEPDVLHDVAGLEGAVLAMGQRGFASPPDEITIHLTHDPRRLLSDPSQHVRGPSDTRGGFDVTATAGPTGPKLVIRACAGHCLAVDLAPADRTPTADARNVRSSSRSPRGPT